MGVHDLVGVGGGEGHATHLVEEGRGLCHEEEGEGREEGRHSAQDQEQAPVDKVKGADVEADGSGDACCAQQPPGEKRCGEEIISSQCTRFTNLTQKRLVVSRGEWAEYRAQF